VCCSVLQCVAVCCSLYQESCVRLLQTFPGRGRCVAACCSVLQYGAVFIKRAVCDFCRHSLGEAGVLVRVAVCCSMLQSLSREQCVTFADIPWERQVCCSVLQCVSVCCSLYQESCVRLLQTFPWRLERQVCCSVLRCVAVRCSVLQRVAV